MTNWYVTREAFKRAANIEGTDLHPVIDRHIGAGSRLVDGLSHTRFIPLTATRYLPYSNRYLRGGKLYFQEDLWSLTSLKDQGTTLRTLTADTHFTLEPANFGPPYHWAEILQSQAISFESGATTPQRSFQIIGQWSRYSATKPASQLDGAITSGTTLQVDDGSKVEVGNTLLIESEAIFVSERDEVDLAKNTTAALTVDDTEVTIALEDPATDLAVGELIRIDGEKMRVMAVNSATSVVVERAVDGSNLAAHLSGADIYVFRRFTVERGVNGTTSASHADNTAISKYTVPGPIEELAVAEAVAAYQQERGGWGGVFGASGYQGEWSQRSLDALRERVLGQYRRHLMVAI